MTFGSDEIAEQIFSLTEEVKILRESVDELKTSLEWAIRHARVTVEFTEAAAPYREVKLPFEELTVGDRIHCTIGGATIIGEIADVADDEKMAMVEFDPTINSTKAFTPLPPRNRPPPPSEISPPDRLF